jgi:hypothetical protein
MKKRIFTRATLILSILAMLAKGRLEAQEQPSASQQQIQAQQLRQQQQMRQTVTDPQPAPAGQTPYFTAYQDGQSNMVLLQWQLATELNTDRYVVEHATDTIHFSPMNELVAREGGGAGPQYRVQDNNAAGKLNYYRLLIIGKDGTTFTSSPVMVDMSGQGALSIKPTVLNMGSTLRLNTYYDRPLMVNFFDGSGRMVAGYLVHGSTFDVNTSTWTKGLYVYRFSDPQHAMISQGKIMVL